MSCLQNVLHGLHISCLFPKLINFSQSQLKDIQFAGKYQFADRSTVKNYREAILKLYQEKQPAIIQLG